MNTFTVPAGEVVSLRHIEYLSPINSISNSFTIFLASGKTIEVKTADVEAVRKDLANKLAKFK